MNSNFDRFQKLITNPFQFAFFKIVKLPAAFFAGLKIGKLTAEESIVLVKHGWLNQNPFKSMYFAVQLMAAEMSTGLFVIAQTYKRNPTVSMLVIKVEGSFHKKATGLISFTCKDAAKVEAIIDECISSGEAKTLVCESIATNENGDLVAEFLITWSFKSRKL